MFHARPLSPLCCCKPAPPYTSAACPACLCRAFAANTPRLHYVDCHIPLVLNSAGNMNARFFQVGRTSLWKPPVWPFSTATLLARQCMCTARPS